MSKKRILLADDARLFLEMEKAFFSNKYFDVHMAHNGREVMETLSEERILPHLIFMDLHMPDMGGDECCRLIKSIPRLENIPVIMVTTAGREDDLRLCREAGCDEIILKPINRHQFMETVTRFIEMLDRSTLRYTARLRISFGKDQDSLLSHFTINLSTGGVFLESENILPLDTPLMAEFSLPSNSRKIRCNAKVAWINHPEMIKNPHLPVGMGLQFLDISMADMDAIRNYIKTEKLLPSW